MNGKILMINSQLLNNEQMSIMQTIDILATFTVIKWLFGVIVTLLAFIGLIGGYSLRKIHHTIINDHELITKDHEIIQEIKPMVYDHQNKITRLITQHNMLHPNDVKIPE